MPCASYLGSSEHIGACLEQHLDRLHMPIVAGIVEGGAPTLQHIPTETGHGHGPLHPSANPPNHTATIALAATNHFQPLPAYTMLCATNV